MTVQVESQPLDLPAMIRGHSVACTGRLASMSRDDFAELIESHGGQYTLHVAAGTGLLVVGQKDWPLTRAGTLVQTLRKARVLTRRLQSRLVVISEDGFLKGLGLESHRQTLSPLYSTTTLTELLGVSRERVVAWVKAGLIKPAATEHGVWHFDFRQVSAAKTLCELTRCGVNTARLRKSLEQLRAWMPDAAYPLEQLSVMHDDGRLFVRLADGDLAALDGQLHFDFTDEPQSPPMRINPGPRTSADWLAQGLEQEGAGLHAEARESYRQALSLGGPDAQLCFNLANVLRELGELPAAIERYRQALEIDPSLAEVWNNLGMVLAELDDHDQAAAAFRKALTINPDDFRAHYNLADTLNEQGLRREAADHWRAYLRHDSSSAWAAYARAQLAAI